MVVEHILHVRLSEESFATQKENLGPWGWSGFPLDPGVGQVAGGNSRFFSAKRLGGLPSVKLTSQPIST